MSFPSKLSFGVLEHVPWFWENIQKVINQCCDLFHKLSFTYRFPAFYIAWDISYFPQLWDSMIGRFIIIWKLWNITILTITVKTVMFRARCIEQCVFENSYTFSKTAHFLFRTLNDGWELFFYAPFTWETPFKHLHGLNKYFYLKSNWRCK